MKDELLKLVGELADELVPIVEKAVKALLAGESVDAALTAAERAALAAGMRKAFSGTLQHAGQLKLPKL